MKNHTGLFLALFRGLAFGAVIFSSGAEAAERTHWYNGFYLGFAPGYANIKIPGRDVRMEGIDFTDVTAEQSPANLRLFMGYWINDYVGLEGSSGDYGSVDATFNYFDLPSERGFGETTVSLSGAAFSIVLGYPVGDVHFYGRGGVMAWTSSYETTFFLPSGEDQRRTLEKNGSDMCFGVGVIWNFTGNWHLRADGEITKIDIADVKGVSVGLAYQW